MRKQIREGMNCRAQVGFAARRKVGKKTKQAQHLLSAPPNVSGLAICVENDSAADAIQIFKTDVTERGGDFFCIIDFCRRTFRHRAAGIDQR